MRILEMVNLVIFILFAICYCYQAFYMVIPLFSRRKIANMNKDSEKCKKHRYAVMVAARNEECVIGQLIDSIKKQNYPTELIDIFVVADNCTDNTAGVCRDAGGVVFERRNTEYVGKGYALKYLTSEIIKSGLNKNYDGYFVFDADNILDRNYFQEMNACFANGARIVTSYRNSKNFDDNWISASYGLWFIRESQSLNLPRELLRLDSVIYGTGYMFHRDIFERNNGWNYLLLSEDMEFTIDNILQDERIRYCPSAVFYDEQPTTFRDSWIQRSRWVKGYLQVFTRYTGRITKEVVHKKKFSCYDIPMSLIPAVFLSIVSLLFNSVIFIVELACGTTLFEILLPLIFGFVSNYLLFLFLGAFTAITERKKIHCSTRKLIKYLFAFPIFILSYLPIAVYASFKKITWSPTNHKKAVTIEDIRKA